ncbi:MAG TPA: sigma-70 family RNA polymerase sigma factor [Vicinamibacterales bacterium]|jgi:RNA polymerase sigma-70 factor (ECF subfamily)|nr:sigma-70 family RNA polymerase sigma factor [Vicinamibacterales bacterium]
MRDMTFSEIERLGAAVGEADEAFHMDEDAFRVFYERTARSVWAYLSRMTGDARLADDLLQETYYRFLRAGGTHESDAHRRNYLFRIATNLVHDHRRRPRADRVEMTEQIEAVDARLDTNAANLAERTVRRLDLARAMGRLKPRERHMLWLAYANGSSHREIADALGLKRASIKLLLFRARRRLANLLRESGA